MACGKASAFDLETNFAFYGAYHTNPINIFLHIITVWPTFFTFAMLLHFTPSILDASQVWFLDHHRLVLNVGFLSTLAYALFYVVLDKRAGAVAAILCFSNWVGASFTASSFGFSQTWKVVLAVQVLCASAQLLGHWLFEVGRHSFIVSIQPFVCLQKRAPAFFDSSLAALLTAPFFLLLEVLHKSIGYEPYPGFHERVKAKTEAEIKAWNGRELKTK